MTAMFSYSTGGGPGYGILKIFPRFLQSFFNNVNKLTRLYKQTKWKMKIIQKGIATTGILFKIQLLHKILKREKYSK